MVSPESLPIAFEVDFWLVSYSVPLISLATTCVYTTNIRQQGLYLSTQPCLHGVFVQLLVSTVFLIDPGLLRGQSSRPAFRLTLACFLVDRQGVYISRGFSVTS